MEQTSKPRIGRIIFVLCFLFLIIIVTILLFWEIFKFSIIVKTFNYVVQNIINVSGMSHWLAKGLVVIAMIPFIWALGEVFKIKFKINIFRKKALKSYRKIAVLVIISYIALFFSSMYFFNKGTYFGHFKGEATKYYAVTPEGLRIFDTPGFDPKYGIELKPMTPLMIEQIERAKLGKQPKRINATLNTEFFDSITGAPKIWFFRDKDGNYEFFDQPGFHPVYWEELKPITPGIVTKFRKEDEDKKRIEQEDKKKELINDMAKKGKEYFEQGDYVKGQQLFLKVLEISPDHAESKDYLRRIEETIPKTILEYSERGKQYLDRGLPEDARKCFEKVLESDSDNSEATKYLLFLEGLELYKKGEFNECISRLQLLTIESPSFFEAFQYLELAKFISLGMNKYESGNFDDCIYLMSRVLEKDPENLNAKKYISLSQRELEIATNPFYGISIADCIINPKRHQILLPIRNRAVPLEWTSGTKGVQVKYLDSQSLANLAGLNIGDVIIKINNENISNVEKFFAKTSKIKMMPDTSIKLNIYDGNGMKELVIRKTNMGPRKID